MAKPACSPEFTKLVYIENLWKNKYIYIDAYTSLHFCKYIYIYMHVLNILFHQADDIFFIFHSTSCLIGTIVMVFLSLHILV